jgi:PPM family protein phosphatase
MIHVQAAGLTDVGKKRDGNEDAYFIDDARQLYVVADGMGGHLAGEVASGLVVETLQGFFETCDGASLTIGNDELSADANQLVRGICQANKAVRSRAQSSSEFRGMGSTLASVYLTDSTVIAANVGDSPIYLVHDGAIELISVMHTVAAEIAATRPERAHMIDERILHMLTRAIGTADDVLPDVCEMQCFTGDVFLLCSDGLSNKVSMDEIERIVMENTAQDACKNLVDLANERGGEDNITVVIIKITGVDAHVHPFKRLLLRLLKEVKNYFSINS